MKCITLLLMLPGCLPVVEASAQKADAVDEVRLRLKGAAFRSIQVRKRPVSLSDAGKMDTLILTVPAGKVSETKSVIRIKTADNRFIYQESFSTWFFSKEVLIPDSIPGNTDVAAFERQYILSLSRQEIERRISEAVTGFLRDRQVRTRELRELQPAGTIPDRAVFNRIVKGAPAIWLPCFECDEGVRYIGWSAGGQKAVVFMETD